MSQRRFWGAATVAALICVTATISTGQTPPAQEWSVITITQIKPEFRVEYEGVQEVSAVYRKANVSRVVVQTILGDLDEYISVTPLGKYAELDGQSVLAKAMGMQDRRRS